MLSLTPAARISEDTWNRLKQAQAFEVRLGEETLTDILTLDFARLAGKHEIRLFQTPKPKEAKQGTDLEVFLNTGRGTTIRYAIQAKKLYPRKGYTHINAKAGKSSRSQIDVLEDHAKRVGAIPFYLLYNYINHAEASGCWNCCQCLVDEKQLGCTLVPSWHIREAIRLRGCRTFDFLHSYPEALPLRCRFDCPNRLPWKFEFRPGRVLLPSNADIDEAYPAPYGWVNFEPREGDWPEWLWDQNQRIISTDEARELFPGSTTETALPRRIVLVRPNLNVEENVDDFERPAR